MADIGPVCPHCRGRYASNTCPAGPDKHMRNRDEFTPDGQPMRAMAHIETSKGN